jgi:hypothetical protein
MVDPVDQDEARVALPIGVTLVVVVIDPQLESAPQALDEGLGNRLVTAPGVVGAISDIEDHYRGAELARIGQPKRRGKPDFSAHSPSER